MPHAAIKVNIGLKANGHADYPDFNQLPAAVRDTMDWSHFVDRHGGWQYDQVAGHADDDPPESSPIGMQWGMLIVPEAFADAAVAAFPGVVSVVDDIEARRFYEERAHVRDPAIRENLEVLQAIKVKRDLGIAEDQQDRNALNPDHPAAGRRRNKLKDWAGFKKQRAFTLRA